MPTSILSPRIAVYTGTFDPVHLGHLDIIQRGSHLFEELIVGVGVNPDKQTLFTPEERVELTREVSSKWKNVKVVAFEGLAVKFVRECGARVVLRGLRTSPTWSTSSPRR